MLISGGTGSGKTTTLNALTEFIGDGERIVTVEDAAELRLRHAHVVRLEARPASLEGRGEVTVRRLVSNALRMRPDRIVVGEVRGGEALDMLSAMSSGHDGSLSTVHAGSPEEALRRVETLALMAGLGLPHEAIREQVAGALDLVVHQARMPDGARRVVAVSEVVRVAAGVGGVGVRELYALRDGRPTWRAPLGDRLAARLAAAQTPTARHEPGRPARRPGGRLRAARRLGGDRRRRARSAPCSRVGAGWRRCFDVLRSGREPTSPERRRLALLGVVALLGGGWLVAGPWAGIALGAAAPWVARAVVRARRRRRARAVVRGRARDRPRAVRRARRRALRARRARSRRRATAASPGRRARSCASRRPRSTSASAPSEVLRDLARRAGGGPLDTLAAAVLLQRDAGGDLAALLRDLAAALEARGRVVADARSATAQARFTALLVTALPAAGLALGELAQPGFVLRLAGVAADRGDGRPGARAAGRRVRVGAAHRAGGRAAVSVAVLLAAAAGTCLAAAIADVLADAPAAPPRDAPAPPRRASAISPG